MAGAAFLRSSLARNRRRLTRYGVLFPSSHLGDDGGHRDAVLDVLDLSSADAAPTIGAWDRLAETARDWRRGKVVVSHELLADATVDQVENVVGSFGDCEVHVVYAARGLADQIPLAWRQWVRNGGTATFAAYAHKIVTRDAHRMSKVFWASHDAGEVLRRWSTFVPAERVHVLTVPAGTGQVPVLWDRFVRTIGLDPQRLRPADDPDAVLTGLVGTEVLRLLNVAAVPGADRAGLERVRRALAPVSDTTPAMSAVHESWLREETDRQVAAVKNGGYHVVGDVTELMPAADAFAKDDNQVVPAAESVLAAQTQVLARLTGLLENGEGPAGVHRRTLRRLLDRGPVVSRLRRR